jgi:hypothetical protein
VERPQKKETREGRSGRGGKRREWIVTAPVSKGRGRRVGQRENELDVWDIEK